MSNIASLVGIYLLRGTVSIEEYKSLENHTTSMLKIANGCSFQTITPAEILRDRLVFGIKDQQAREKLLRKANLTLGGHR